MYIPLENVTAYAKARERRKLRLQNFRKALESIDDAARGAFGSKSSKKNKEKNQTINPQVATSSGLSGQTDELTSDSRFEKIQAIHDDATGLIEEGLTFPRQGSVRSTQRREEIIKKINQKKDGEGAQLSENAIESKPIIEPLNNSIELMNMDAQLELNRKQEKEPLPHVPLTELNVQNSQIMKSVNSQPPTEQDQLKSNTSNAEKVEEIPVEADFSRGIDDENQMTKNDEKHDEKNDEAESGNTDLVVGLERHDYKTLSDTPKMKPFGDNSIRQIIKPYEYDKIKNEQDNGM